MPKDRIIRAAVVQLEYQPAVSLAYSYLDEPALLNEGEQGISTLPPNLPLADKLQNFRTKVRTAHHEALLHRATSIIKKLDALGTDVVVFPEYSIPASCLGEVGAIAGSTILVAASHTVTSESLSLCTNLGLKLDVKDLGKSVCPIRLANGQWTHVDKLTKSRWEGPARLGSRWQLIETSARSGCQITFAVFICIDFLNELDDNVQETIARDVWRGVDFGAIPAYSPTIRDFEQKSNSLLERTGCPILFANAASLGGSRVACMSLTQGAFTTNTGTKPLARLDEAAIVVDIPIGNFSQFQKRPSPVPTPPTSELVVLLPILPENDYQQFFDLGRRIQATDSEQEKRILVEQARPDLLKLASQADIPDVLRTKIFDLLGAFGWRNGQWVSACVDGIGLTHPSARFPDWRFQLLHEAQGILGDIVRYSPVSGITLETVTSSLDVYRRHLDALRTKVRPELLQRLDSSGRTIHTAAEGTPDSFTSLFLLRLKGERLHREALEKQIRLISTIAHPQNRNLALNLRYVSFPNPGGNLKQLEIQIIGAARADDRLRSREMADGFRRDLAELMRITLQDAYLFETSDIDREAIARAKEPFSFNYIVELSRKVDFGTPPYIDGKSAPKIHHLAGSSSMSRILDLLQSHPHASMVSVHLHPILLSEAELTFFESYLRSRTQTEEIADGAMFFLGTEKHPALRLGDAVTMQRMLGVSGGLRPSLLTRLFVASEEPISSLLVNTIGYDLWSDDTYQIRVMERGTEEHGAGEEMLRTSWALSSPQGTTEPVGLSRVPYLFDPYEASRLFRLPLEGYSGAVRNLFAVIPAPAAALPDDGIEIGLGFHAGAQRPIVIRLSEQERTKHTYVIGKTGTGKSTLLGRMIEQDVQAGHGVCVIDPHGDLIDAVLARIPEGREHEVVFLDPANIDRPFGLNLLEFNDAIPHHKDLVLQDTIGIMRKLFYFEHSGPIFEHNLRHLILTMMDESMRGLGTLIEVPIALYDSDFRKAIVPRLRDPLARDFWKQYQQLGTYTTSENLWYVISKFDTFTTDHIMRNIVGQSHSTINFQELMNRKAIILVKLPSALIGELNAALLGMIVVSKLRWAGLARAAIHPSRRSPFHIYVDEFQMFATSGFETILAEARKFGLSLTLAHQHIGQLSAFHVSSGTTDARTAAAIFGNVGTMIVFRVGVADAEYLAKELGPPVDPDDLENLKNYHAIMKTVMRGEVYSAFTVRTVLSHLGERGEFADQVRTHSVGEFGRPREEVVELIAGRRELLMGFQEGESGSTAIAEGEE